MREAMDLALPLVGPALVALTLAMWARYALIRSGDDDEVPRLRVPVTVTGVLVTVLAVIALLETRV